MRELQTGLWHWQAPHPAWERSEPWSQEVSSYAIDDGQRLLLFDPLGVPGEIEGLAAGRETAIVLTCPWHERDTQSLVERLSAAVFVPPPDEGSPDVYVVDIITGHCSAAAHPGWLDVTGVGGALAAGAGWGRF